MSSFTAFNTALTIRGHGNHPTERNTYLWEVVDGFEYYLEDAPEYVVRVPGGFLTDGASVPRPLWILLPPWAEYGQAAVLHDYLLDVGTIKNKVDPDLGYVCSRSEARKHFVHAMKVLKVPRWKRYLLHFGVWIYDQWSKVF